MTLLGFLFLLGIISFGYASENRHVARGTVSLIGSVSPTAPAVPSETAQAEAKKHSKHVNDFFKLYGWLKPGTTVPDSELPKAIRKIQHVLKEPVTGIVSDKMMDIMSRPHCGTEQPYNETDAKAPPGLHKRFVLWGSKWGKQTVTWRFVNYTADTSSSTQQSTIRSVYFMLLAFGRLEMMMIILFAHSCFQLNGFRKIY